MGIPSPAPKPWFVRETWPAVAALLFGGSSALFTAYKAIVAVPQDLWLVRASLLSGASVISISTIRLLQSRYKDAKSAEEDSPKDLRGCLHVIYRTVAGYKNAHAPEDAWLRVTIHRVDKNDLQQVVPYVGAADANKSKGGSVGRRFPIGTGIIGKVARSKQSSRVSRPKDVGFDEWKAWLVENTGMTTEQAADTRSDRYSFLGIPIDGPDGEISAVLYLDSKDHDFFDDSTVEIVASGCVGLAKWIDERYYRK